MEQLYSSASEKMNKTIEALKGEFAGIRTGRANTGLIEGVKVESYGTFMNLRDVATISAPDSQMLAVAPWDSSLLNAIAKAIQNASLGLNPVVDAGMVRVPIPSLTEERRRDLLKVVNEKTENAKVSLRGIRREAIDSLNALEKSKDIGEDDNKRMSDRIQKLVDQFSEQIQTLATNKEKDLMTV